jgi:hypothetical protein
MCQTYLDAEKEIMSRIVTAGSIISERSQRTELRIVNVIKILEVKWELQ